MRDQEPKVPSASAIQRLRRSNQAPSAATLMAVIQFLAEHTERIIFGDHAQSRMEERGITDEDVFRVLRLGEISGRIVMGLAEGEWKCKVVAKLRGSRAMGVATIVLCDDYLFIKTVEWEDR